MAIDFIIVIAVIKFCISFPEFFEGHGDVKILRDQHYRPPSKSRGNPTVSNPNDAVGSSPQQSKPFQNDFMFDLFTGYLIEIFQLTSVSWFCLLPIFSENHLEFSVSIICKDSMFKNLPAFILNT